MTSYNVHFKNLPSKRNYDVCASDIMQVDKLLIYRELCPAATECIAILLTGKGWVSRCRCYPIGIGGEIG